jgi:hypothetical protein
MMRIEKVMLGWIISLDCELHWSYEEVLVRELFRLAGDFILLLSPQPQILNSFQHCDALSVRWKFKTAEQQADL